MKGLEGFAPQFKNLMTVIALSARNGHIVDPENVYPSFVRELKRLPAPERKEA